MLLVTVTNSIPEYRGFESRCHTKDDRGNLVVGVSDRGWHATSSSPVPLKTHLVGERCTLNLPRAQTSSRWCGVVVRRGGCPLRCRSRHLTMVQNYEVFCKKPLCN
ncbi:uncharacterized protein TNCV_2852731 [Trichonephila clavipes]|uniref:Uncharacterized protein n=1 Tax=Trichonephila clavipes TaxID=2585209 RepID=A0A8X6R5U8_TRICX|nr:uncharacterized protein TNCV_2852731 [Trichonephila clavipes]